MSKTKITDSKTLSVPQQVFEQFLKELETQKVPEEVIVRLKKTLVSNEQISIESLRESLFSNDNVNT